MPRRGDLGKRKHSRVKIETPGFVILEPSGPWIACLVRDISESGAGLNVGTVVLPETFVLLLSVDGKVRRLCRLIWRAGELVGVRFIKPNELLAVAATPS